MKKGLFLFLFLFMALVTQSQTETIRDTVGIDSIAPLPRPHFRIFSAGTGWFHTNTQFFDGYNSQILTANAQSGLPLYSDWLLYSPQALMPTFQKYGAYFSICDSLRNLRIRFSGGMNIRRDTMAYGSNFTQNDTVYGRLASERSRFVFVGVSIQKATKEFLGCLRLYGGAELELGFCTKSSIGLEEYAYDVGDKLILQYNTFSAVGKPRMHSYVVAALGMETNFFNRMGLFVEVQSGVGGQLAAGERAFGLSRNQISMGMNYYFAPGHWR